MWPAGARIVADRIEVSYERSTHRIEYADGTASEIPVRGRGKERRRFTAILGSTASADAFRDWALGIRGAEFDYPDCFYGTWPARFVEGSRGIRLRRRRLGYDGEEWTAVCNVELDTPALPPVFEGETAAFTMHDGYRRPYALAPDLFVTVYAYWGGAGSVPRDRFRRLNWIALEEDRIVQDGEPAGSGTGDIITPPPGLPLVNSVTFSFAGESFSFTAADNSSLRFTNADYPGDGFAAAVQIARSDLARYRTARAELLRTGGTITVRLEPVGKSVDILTTRIAAEAEASFTANARRYQADGGVTLQQDLRRTVLEARELRGWLTDREAPVSAVALLDRIDEGGLFDIVTSGGTRRALLPGGRAALGLRARALNGQRTWDTIVRCQLLPAGWSA